MRINFVLLEQDPQAALEKTCSFKQQQQVQMPHNILPGTELCAVEKASPRCWHSTVAHIQWGFALVLHNDIFWGGGLEFSR